MAINISGLVENITSSVGDFFKVLRGDAPTDGVYLESVATENVLSKFEKGNWVKNLPYEFAITDKDGNETVTGFSPFQLPINPQDISQDEIPAIMLTPTQGGTTVNYNGVRYKDLTISGTTGVHPGRGAGGASKRTGKANFQPNQLKYVSGYESFLRLRNWFKAYYQMKKNNPQTLDYRMVFRNYKDGDFLQVELTKFSMKRSSARRFMYDYTMTFRVLGHVTFEPEEPGFLENLDNVLNTALDAVDTARGIFLRTQDILNQVESTYENIVLEPLRKLSLTLKALNGVITTAADLGPNLIATTMTAKETLQTLQLIQRKQKDEGNAGTLGGGLSNAKLPNNINQAVENNGAQVLGDLGGDALFELEASDLPASAVTKLAEEQTAALQNPKSFYSDLREDLKRLRDNTADLLNLGDATYDDVFNRQNTLGSDSTKVITDEEFEVLEGFNQAIRGLDLFLTSNTLFKSSYPQLIADINDRFNGEIGLLSEEAVKEIPMPANTDLERLALRELGDPNRWVEIVELNGLKPPYVTQDLSSTLSNVVKPGEKILIPQPVISGFGNAPIPGDLPVFQGLTTLEKNLAVDLRLDENFDLELTNSNDFQVIKGTDNASQAIILKLSLEKGDLLRHPEIGVGLTPGTKSKPITEIQNQLVQSLTQDPRFERIERLEILQVNNEIRLKFTLYLKNVDIPIPLEIRV